MTYARTAVLSIICLLTVGHARADEDNHRHTWEPNGACSGWTCVKSCCQRTCYERCTYAGCQRIRPVSDTKGECPGGASASSTPLLMSIDPEPMAPWSPRPGAAPGCNHEWAEDWNCGPWSKVSDDCHKRRCYDYCSKCKATRPDSRTEYMPDGCGSAANDAPPTSWVPVSGPWGPRPGASPQGGCRDGLDHDWGDERCGEYSRPYPSKPDCEVAHCDRKCNRCGTNGKSRLDKRGQCAAPSPSDTALVSTPWAPRPGSGTSDACPPHDWSGPSCGGWSNLTDKCRVRHCTYQCRKCLTNGRDYYDQEPAGCMGD